MISKIKTTVIAALGLFFVAGITQASAATVNLQGDFTAQTFLKEIELLLNGKLH